MSDSGCLWSVLVKMGSPTSLIQLMGIHVPGFDPASGFRIPFSVPFSLSPPVSFNLGQRGADR